MHAGGKTKLQCQKGKHASGKTKQPTLYISDLCLAIFQWGLVLIGGGKMQLSRVYLLLVAASEHLKLRVPDYSVGYNVSSHRALPVQGVAQLHKPFVAAVVHVVRMMKMGRDH